MREHVHLEFSTNSDESAVWDRIPVVRGFDEIAVNVVHRRNAHLIAAVRLVLLDTGGEGSLTQWVHCELVVSFEAIRPVITQQVCGEFF